MLEPLAISLIEGSTARIAFAARRFLIGCLALAVFVVAVPSPTSTQRQLGGIQGTIIDRTGAVLPGVAITVTNANVSSTNFGVVGGLRTPGGGLPGSRLIQLGLKWMF